MVKQRNKPVANDFEVKSIPLYIISDATGSLAKHMVTSFLTQFPGKAFEMHLKPFVSEPDRLARALAAIADRPGIVFHAVVAPELKRQITRRCRELELACCDLTGPTVDFLAKASKIKPVSDPRHLHRVDDLYCDRINAMTFTLEHDDGLGLETLDAADIVITAVSRTGKTPTSVYLAMQGYRVANVSLAMGVEPPRQLLELKPGKTVGLVIDPRQLAEIRTRRQTAWRMAQTQYNDPLEVRAEIDWSRRLFAKLQCPVLDVTDHAIEETAARLVDLLGFTQPPCHAVEGLS
jgi:[pyruvate, water dikinase]-phosphate phosphotransferase / [pyruvate, water dikinase] kinase